MVLSCYVRLCSWDTTASLSLCFHSLLLCVCVFYCNTHVVRTRATNWQYAGTWVWGTWQGTVRRDHWVFNFFVLYFFFASRCPPSNINTTVCVCVGGMEEETVWSVHTAPTPVTPLSSTSVAVVTTVAVSAASAVETPQLLQLRTPREIDRRWGREKHQRRRRRWRCRRRRDWTCCFHGNGTHGVWCNALRDIGLIP
jgi:hypothetical protein